MMNISSGQVILSEGSSSGQVNLSERSSSEENTIFSDKHVVILRIIASFTAVIIIAGLIGNVTSAVVLHKMTKSNKAMRLLKYLTFVDMTLLVLVFLEFDMRSIQVDSWNAVYLFFFPFASLCALTLYTFEIYLTVLIAVQRCLAVAIPFRFSKYMSERTINGLLIFNGVFSIAFNIPHWVACNPELYWNPNYEMYMMTLGDYTFYDSRGYEIYRRYVTLVFRCVIPVVILIVCNIILVVTRQKMSTTAVPLGTNDSRDKLTAIVIAITVMSLVTHVTSAMDLTLGLYVDPVPSHYIYVITVFAVTINTSTNFIFYCSFGIEFRRIFKAMCHC